MDEFEDGDFKNPSRPIPSIPPHPRTQLLPKPASEPNILGTDCSFVGGAIKCFPQKQTSKEGRFHRGPLNLSIHLGLTRSTPKGVTGGLVTLGARNTERETRCLKGFTNPKCPEEAAINLENP